MGIANTAPATGVNTERPLYGYRTYNIINNAAGWICFLIAAVTYMLTLEPTASFWDCPEFISQGAKLEVGHPPGNPIFILAARFFINFAGGNVSHYAIAVNAMSGLLSAATILLLFWTITHLVRRLMVGRSQQALTLSQLLTVMGAGVCGALVYTWSDTFWFSAVEGEVYAFSSFCTALVFWLILKWDNRADEPHADRYLILVAYVIGVSIGVHLLNLLTIPALGLIIYYRKADSMSKSPAIVKTATWLMWAVAAGIAVITVVLLATGYYAPALLALCVCSMCWFYRGSLMFKYSILTLMLSFVVVALILYGLVPGFIEIAQYFELFCVNKLGMSYNIGVLLYAVILLGVLVWCVSALYRQKSRRQIQWSFLLSVVLSGIPFIGSSALVPVVLIGALAGYLFLARRLSVRFLTLTALSILVIFIGYTSYTLLLVRASAQPPMNQNAPDNVFTLSSYLNREQYGDTPLFYGPAFTSSPEYTIIYDETGNPMQELRSTNDKSQYAKVVKTDSLQPDQYVETEPRLKPRYVPNMVFPRLYSQNPGHPQGYLSWIGETMESLPKEKVTVYYDEDGEVFSIPGNDLREEVAVPTFEQNLRYFFDYQLNYMYWRYFLWNFSGRQNDLQGQGEMNRGNWITGIPFFDNPRLGDQSLLPPDQGSANKGHNVFYMLPLLMGLLGIAAQLVRGKEGICQFWVVFIFFFMTGIAIVLYLNQPPMQVRERDYAYAGSFYAFSIWVGMGVYGLWLLVRWLFGKKRNAKGARLAGAAVACVAAVLVPLQMVSQTWDDHDRSGRYTTRDFGMNYLASLDENAIIFTNGDNDTFPLWYAQEVEGYRTDVRVVNLSYLTTDWYANHQKLPSYNAPAIDFQAQPEDYAYDRMQSVYVFDNADGQYLDVFSALNDLYVNPAAEINGIRALGYPRMYIPVDIDEAVKAGVISADEAAAADDYISVDWSKKRMASLGDLLSLDMIAHGAADGWKRPAYFAMTVPDDYYLNLSSNLRSTGLAYEVTPLRDGTYERTQSYAVATDKMYDNVMNRFRWGGLDSGKDIYLDETVRRMVTTHRSALIDLANALYEEGLVAEYSAADSVAPAALPYDSMTDEQLKAFSTDRYRKAVEVLDLMQEKLPASLSPYSVQVGQQVGQLYVLLGEGLGDEAIVDKGLDVLLSEIEHYAPHVPYLFSLLERKSNPKATVYDLEVTNVDSYVPYYLYQLIKCYGENGGNSDALVKALNRVAGPDFNTKFERVLQGLI
ncbi:MAG: DUF2723 domain-containing protein [Bacteroidales bacterium]|nr:DUF2723 domain-containing protein [Bacteroidales bacterium]